MLAELATQLRGEAGPRQVKGAEIALAENGGGVIGMEEAVASVVILQRGLSMQMLQGWDRPCEKKHGCRGV